MGRRHLNSCEAKLSTKTRTTGEEENSKSTVMALARAKTNVANTGQLMRLVKLTLLAHLVIEATVYIAVCQRVPFRVLRQHQDHAPITSAGAARGEPIKRAPVMVTYWSDAGMRKALDFGTGSPSSSSSSSWLQNKRYGKQYVQLGAPDLGATAFTNADGSLETSASAAAIAADPHYRSYPPLVPGDSSLSAAAHLSEPLRELSVVRDRSGMAVRHYPAMNEISQNSWPTTSDASEDLRQAPSGFANTQSGTKGRARVSGVKGVRVATRGYKPQTRRTNDTDAPRVSSTGAWAFNSAGNKSASDASSALRPRASNRKNLVCYYGSWAVYRPDGGKFPVENIDPFLCTHIIYGFTGLSFDNQIKPLDPWNDLEDNYGKGAMKRFTNLKRINPDLKTLIAIGGWNEGSIKYSKMASEPEARARFVKSVVDFLQKYNFDGLDLDWEYPASRGGHSYDKANFVRLVTELKQAFAPKNYLLTAAVSAGKWFIDPAYDIAAISRQLDLINLMTYDYHGGWETKTGMNAPLFSSKKYDLKAEDKMLNVNWSVNYWLQMGAPREKLMLGVGSYGRSFTLDKAQVNGINAPASQKGQAGPYTREPGSLGYNEICESIRSQPSAWTIVREPDYLAPYAYNDRQWVGYDDQESLALKAQFAKSMGLGGVMMWSIETDDFAGRCHNEKYPLLNTIRRTLDGSGSPGAGSTSTTLAPPPTSTAKPVTRPPAPPSSPAPPATARPTTRLPGSVPASTRVPKPVTVTPPTRTTAVGREVEEDGSTEATSSATSTKRPVSSGGNGRRPSNQRPSTTRPTTQSVPATSPSRTTTTTTTTPRPAVSQPVSSTTTTTREPAPRPPTSDQFTCPGDGMFGVPNNCRKFVRCVGEGTPFFRLYYFDCGPGTAYNEASQYCDFIYNVPSCKQQQVSMFSIGDSSLLIPSAAYTQQENVVLGYNTSAIENQVRYEDTLAPSKRRKLQLDSSNKQHFHYAMPRWG